MKKHFTFGCLLMAAFISLLTFSAMRVSAQNDFPYQVHYRIIPETCQGGGGFEIFILTNNNDTIHIDPVTDEPTDPSFKLKQVQFYAYSETDSVKGPDPRMIVDNIVGTWTIGVSAHYNVGTGGADSWVAKKWELENIILNEDVAYMTPNIFPLMKNATDSWSCGNRFTLPCASTGRIQMGITGGTFPYHIIVVDTVSGDTVRDIYFHTNQYDGWDESQYDYRDYYSIDSLPAGIYRVYFSDSCGTKIYAKSLVYNIREAVIPYPTDLYFYGPKTDDELVSFRFGRCYIYFTEGDIQDYLYNDGNNVVQYRVCYGAKDTSEWKSFPLNGIYRDGDNQLRLCNSSIYDTATHLSNYCELEGEALTFQYRVKNCEYEIHNFYTGYLTQQTYLNEETTQEALNYAGTYYDSCSYHIPNVHSYTTQLYGYVENNTHSMSSYPIYYSYYVNLLTAPVTWTLTDLTTNETVVQEVRNNISDNYWYIPKADLEDYYGPIEDTSMYLSLRMEVSDTQGCSASYERSNYTGGTINVYDYTDTLDRYLDVNAYAEWWNGCCQNQNYIYLYEYTDTWGNVNANPIPMRFKQLRDGATWRLKRSPLGNKYNFTATYHFDTDSWEVVKDSVSCNALVEPYLNEWQTSYYWGLNLKDYCLSYGEYEFEYDNGCFSTPASYHVFQSYRKYENAFEKPAFETNQVCDRLDVTLTSGKILRREIGVDTGDPMQPEMVMGQTELPTRFRITGGPVGYYPTEDFGVGETFSLSKPGTYTLQMFTNSSTCGVNASFDTTIIYDGGMVSFEYTKAYVCDKDSTVGFLYCRAKDGTAPFTYTLYKEEDGAGVVIGSNTTGIFKNIPNVHYGDHMSVQVRDDCDRSSIKNFYVSDFSSNDLAWFDGGLRLKHTCEGSQIDVYVSSFDTTFTYHWTGPNGFDANTSIGHIFLERNAPSGFYVVELGNTGCAATVKDSVELTVVKSPKITLADSMTVCPGEQVTITSTVEYGRGNVEYIIGKEENSMVTFYNFSGHTGDAETISHLAESEARFWVHQVKDDTCTFAHPEDTIAIILRNMASSCDVTINSPQVCYGASATLEASSPTMLPPYVVRWYADADQQTFLRMDTIHNSGDVSSYPTDALYADMALYVTVQDTFHCETHSGTVSSWLNMSSDPVAMSCGDNIRYFDAGGYNRPYGTGENYRQTFSSTGNDRITISFNSFNTQPDGGVMRIYSGPSVLQDSILAVYSGYSIPEAVTSRGNSLTVVFTSTDGTYNYYEGWDAEVSCSALPAKGEVKVLDALAVTLTATPALPARYGQDITLTAHAEGGEGSQYQYQWFVSDNNQNWTPGRTFTSSNPTDDTTLTNITTSQYVKIMVTDVSAYQCAGNPEETVFIEVAPIELSLQMNTEAREICQGDIPVTLTVENTGEETAYNVKVKLQLPDGMRLADEADTLITIGNVLSHDNSVKLVYVHSEIHAATETNAMLKAQVWSCDQGDMSSNWHSWDWTGMPVEPDEDTLKVKVRPSLDMTDPGTLTVTDAAVCYGADAHFEAHSNIQYPQYFTWYADEALTQELSRETVDGVNKTYSTYDVTNVTSFTPAYVSLRNDQYCPAYTSVDYLTKMDITPTDTILMQNGSYLIGNSDHIRLFDDGGPNGSYSPNRLYKFLFTSLDDSPITIYFDDTYQYISRSNNEGKIEIFDGDNEMVPRYMYYDGEMRGKVVTTSTSGKMLVVFRSGDYTDVGISAHVFTTKRELVGEANVTFNAVMPVEEITTYNAQTCYGDTATLRASTSSTSYPQYFTWYDANLTQVHQDTVETASGKSDYTVPSVTEETPYYVTMGNADYCPVMVASNATTNERTVLLNAANNRKTTPVLPTDVIDFYDAGGSSNGYNSVSYTHIFTGVQGKLKIEMNTYNMREYDTLYAYNGTIANESNLLAKWGMYNSNGSTIESDSASVLFVLRGHGGCCYDGWHARITSPHSGAMAEAKAEFKTVPSNLISAQDAQVCFGDSATLTASAQIGYPQYFTWYGPDRREELWRDTVRLAGDSSKLTILPETEGSYYVYVTNDDYCPLTPTARTNRDSVLMGYGNDRVDLTASDSLSFFDKGGRTGSYYSDCGGYSKYFYAPSGSNIHLHFNSAQFDSYQDAHLNVEFRDENGVWRSETIYGPLTDREFVSYDDYLYVYFYEGCQYEYYPGWEGTIYADTPIDEEKLTKIDLSFKMPVFSNDIVANDQEECYGSPVTLTATTNGGTEQNFVWYDRNFNLLKYETGVTTTFDTIVTENTYYYVNASGTDECPSIPPHYNETVFDVQMNGRVTEFNQAGEAKRLYDEGGKDNSYSTHYANWIHTFKAPSEKHVTIRFTSFDTEGGCDYLCIYDGQNTNNLVAELSGNNDGYSYTTQTGYLTLRWRTDGSVVHPGWDALVGVLNEDGEMFNGQATMTKVEARIKQVNPSDINAPDVQACYGDSVILTASSTIDVPQYYTWYGSDRSEVLWRDTVRVAGASSELPLKPEREGSYYVYVTNDDYCPLYVPARDNRDTVIMGSGNSDIYLTASDSLAFFDMGGCNGDYYSSCNGYSKYFYAPSGSKIHLHFNNIQLDNNQDAHLEVGYYDSNKNWQSETIYGTRTNVDFVSYGERLNVYFSTGCLWNYYPGWDASVYATDFPVEESQLTKIDLTFKSPVFSSDVVAPDREACMGNPVSLTATTSGGNRQNFAWYDRNYNLMKYETGVSSVFDTVVTESTFYYVNASDTNACPSMPPGYTSNPTYGQILFNSSLNGTTTEFTEVGVGYPFYDDGGVDSTYSPNADWTHVFTAPANRQVKLVMNDIWTCEDAILYVYDGATVDPSKQLDMFYGYGLSWTGHEPWMGDGNTVTSTQGALTLRWVSTDCVVGSFYGYETQTTGWRASIGVAGDDGNISVNTHGMTKVNATIRQVASSDITAPDVQVCYGDSAFLTASAQIAYPQYYIWYNAARTEELKRDTVRVAGEVSRLPLKPETEDSYYVFVTNDDYCPLRETLHTHYREINMDLYDYETCHLADTDKVAFFDDGGRNGSYMASCTTYTKTFQAPDESRVCLHVNSLELNDNDVNAYLRISWYNHGIWEERILRGTLSDTEIVSTGNNVMYVYFNTGCDWNTYPGFDSYVYAITPVDESQLTKVDLTFGSPVFSSTIVAPDKEACLGSSVTLTATKDNSTMQNFAWYDQNMNLLKYETGVTTSFDTTVTENTFYYVNASNTDECPSMPPGYNISEMQGRITFNASISGDTSYFTSAGRQYAISVDEGSTSNVDWTHTFVAPGSDQVKLEVQNFWACNDAETLYVYDGYEVDPNAELDRFYGYGLSWTNHEPYYGGGNTVTSTLGALTLRWVSEGGCSKHTTWNGYIGVPNGNGDMSLQYDLTTVKVTLKAPYDPSLITTVDGEACYGQNATLTASANLSYPQYYSWYNSDRTGVLKRDTIASGSSMFVVPAYGNQTYYVAVSCDTTCPVMDAVRDQYKEVLWKEKSDNSYNLSLNDSIGFFDNGGRDNDGNYSDWTSRDFYFNAEDGASIRLHFNSLYMYSGEMYIYNANTGDQIAYLNGNDQSENPVIKNVDYMIPSNSVRLHMYYRYNRINWDAYAYSFVQHDISELADVHSSIKAPLGPADVSTVDGKACYGQPVMLTASADIAVPQYFAWYDEDYNLVYNDTVRVVGDSSHYPVSSVTGTKHYYVAVSNADNCPVVIETPVDVLMNTTNSGRSTDVTMEHPAHFYDAAGASNDYESQGNTLIHTFNAPAGEQLYVTFRNRFGLNSEDRLYVYDGASDTDPVLYTFSTSDNTSEISRQFQSTNGSITFKLESQYYTCCSYGWDAIISLMPATNTEVRMGQGHNITNLNPNETVNFYDEGGRNSYFCIYGDESSYNYTYKQTFTTANGTIKATFLDYLDISDVVLSVYDGPDVDETKLLKQWQGYQNFNNDEVITSTSTSMTFSLHYNYDYTCPSGWRAEITTLPELAVATASVRVVDPSTIATTDAEVCYGTEATLTASSTIGFPQYYEWYSPDRMTILKRDTITSGSSSFTMLPGAEETYYVTVTNDTTCPAVTAIHDNVKVVIMNEGGVYEQHVDVLPNDSILFYDNGGPDGDYDPDRRGYCYFKAPDGAKLRMHLNHLQFNPRGDTYIEVYVRDVSGNNSEYYYYNSQDNLDFISEGGEIRVYFSSKDSRTGPGWDGYVIAITPRPADELAEAHVTFKAPITQNTITADDVEVCYGSEATLTASSTLSYPQEYFWYDPDRTTLLKHEIITSGNSTLAVTPDEETSYYVAVTNADNCPIVDAVRDRVVEVKLNSRGRTYNLDTRDSIRFYDCGGKDADYDRDDDPYIYFRTDEGGLRIHFDTIALATNSARLRIQDNDNGRRIAYLRGPLFTRDLDYVVESGNVEIEFENNSSTTAAGWEGYVYAITPHNEAELKEVNVSFATPAIADNITVTSAEACYGETVILTATSTATEPQRFVWYNDRYELLKDEVATGTSTLNVVATANENYYVNAAAVGQCPVFPPDFDFNSGGTSFPAIVFDGSLDDRSSTFSSPVGMGYPIYDDGGENDDYSQYADWTHTFKAPLGQQVRLEMNDFWTCEDAILYVYDGLSVNSGSELVTLYGYGLSYTGHDPWSGGNNVFTSTTGALTLHWVSNKCTERGWYGMIGVGDAYNSLQLGHYLMPYGTITLKTPLAGSNITTRDDEVCYGSEATLSARSSISFPQSYVWYAPDRITVLKRETINSDSSTVNVTPTAEETYYVAVSNADNCPIVDPIHNHLVVKNIDNQNNNYTLNATDSVRFYDNGGKEGDYWTGWSCNYYFYADQGSYIRIHFDTVQLNSEAYIYIYKEGNQNTQIAQISGTGSNLDYLVESNNVRIYFDGYSEQPAMGWEAYVYAIPQQDMSQLAEASVTFTAPVINSTSIVTKDAEACYGNQALLKATSSLTGNQNFAWFDSDMNLLKQELVPQGDSSTLSVEALGAATYFVNVSQEDECPVLPPNYGSLLFTESINGETTSLTTVGKGIPFFDEGGANGSYYTYGVEWYHTFKAPEGQHVTLKFNTLRMNCCGEYITLYNGSPDNGLNYIWETCSSADNRSFTSDDNMLTVRWRNYGGCRPYPLGWDAVVGILDGSGNMTSNAVDLAEANVTVKAPTMGLPVTTTNDTVCYGSEAHLTAQSTIDYPQYYTWYSPGARSVLLRDTVDGVHKTQSILTAPYYYQYQDQTYFAAVSNKENCPIVMATSSGNNVIKVQLDADAHNKTTELLFNDKAEFYNAGGLNYNSSCGSGDNYTHTFHTLQGVLKAKFQRGDKDFYFGEEDTLYVYDSDHADESRLIGKIYDEMNYNQSFVTTGQSLTFRFEGEGSCRRWFATITPYNLQEDMAKANVTVNVTSVPDAAITVHPDTVCVGGEAVVSASADISYPQYYIWYNEQMEEMMRDTLHDATETASVLHLPAQYADASYYALVYSDTVSCLMLNTSLSNIYSEFRLSKNMDGDETHITSNDSIGFFSDEDLRGSDGRSLDMDYYISAESGLIQIHFDTLILGYETDLGFEDGNLEDAYVGYFFENTYYDVTITSLTNRMRIRLDSKSDSRSFAHWTGYIKNINVVSDTLLTRMAEADVRVRLNNSSSNVTTTNDTVCIGSPALLTASSTIGYPQTYTWYNENMDQVLFQETISSGKSNYYIPSQVGNATYRVAVNNDTTCAVSTVISHNNFREFLMNDATNGKEIFVAATDSVVIYDDGGKYGNYSVPEDGLRVFILTLKTYPGAVIDIDIPKLVMNFDDYDEEGLIILEPDANGQIGMDMDNFIVLVVDSLTDTYHYTSSSNTLYLGWALWDEDFYPASGFELVATSNLHPEKQTAKANVLMKNTLPMTTNAISSATNAVICQNDDAVLEATSTLTDNPQYFLWYGPDLTTVLAVDTVDAGNTAQVTIPNLMQDTLLYVAVGTDDVCPAYPMSFRANTPEMRLNQVITNDTTYLSVVDSILLYDEGGPNGACMSYGLFYHTFFAPEGQHVVVKFNSVKFEDDDNFVAVGEVEGELDEHDISMALTGTEIDPGDSIYVSTGNYLTVAYYIDDLDWDEVHDGFAASVYTDAVLNNDMSVLTPAQVTVNPSYQFEIVDTVEARTAPYSVGIFTNLNVSVAGDYIIDSVYHTAGANCDSTYTLKLHVNPSSIVDTEDPTFTAPADTIICRLVADEMILHPDVAITGVPTDQADDMADYATLVANTTYTDDEPTATDDSIRYVLRHWTVDDGSGHVTEHVQRIGVFPAIHAGNTTLTSPAQIEITLAYGRCDTMLDLGTATYVTTVKQSPITITNDAPAGGRFPVGTFKVVWIATDTCGFMVTDTQIVTVNYPPCGTGHDVVYDNYTYHTVRVGCECWLQENLRNTSYADGTEVSKYGIYNNEQSNEEDFGLLYSWYSAVRVPEGDNQAVPADSTAPMGEKYFKGLCPDGWALPTSAQYDDLWLNGYGVDGIKDMDNQYWLPGNAGTMPNCEFNARGAGYYDNATDQYYNLLGETYFWTGEVSTTITKGKCSVITHTCPELIIQEQPKGRGQSVRCVQKR